MWLKHVKAWVSGLGRLGVLGLAVGLAGCAAPGTGTQRGTRAGDGEVYSDTLRKGDMVEVRFSGSASPPTDIEERIKDDGTISLPLVGAIVAEGKSDGQLQREIHEAFVPRYYRQLTVTVRSEYRVFFVDGEVRGPGRLPYAGQLTVLQAIASAGGFTDFAARRRIELVRRSGEKFVIHGDRAKDNAQLDLPVYPGDRIYVPRRSPFGG